MLPCRPVPNTGMWPCVEFVIHKRLSQTPNVNISISTTSCLLIPVLWYRSKYYGETLLKYLLSTSNHLFQYFVVKFAVVSISNVMIPSAITLRMRPPLVRTMSATCKSEFELFWGALPRWQCQFSVPMHLCHHIWPSLQVFSIILPLLWWMFLPTSRTHYPGSVNSYPKFPFPL